MRQLAVDLLALALLALALFAILTAPLLQSAPVPFPPQHGSKQASENSMAGDWKASWAGVACTMHFSAQGSYHCPFGSANYQGSWRVDSQGNLWITESCNIDDPAGWQSYRVHFDPVAQKERRGPRRLAGTVDVGAPGVRLLLDRAK